MIRLARDRPDADDAVLDLDGVQRPVGMASCDAAAEPVRTVTVWVILTVRKSIQRSVA